MISISDSFDALTDIVKNISNIGVATKLRAANYIDDLFYMERAGIEPETLLKTYTFEVQINVRDYTLPTDFLTLSDKGGVFYTDTRSDLLYLKYDGGTVLFEIGDVVTSSSGGTGTVLEITGTVTSGNLVLEDVDTTAGGFADNDTLTGGGTAVQNGTTTPFGETEVQYSTGSHGTNVPRVSNVKITKQKLTYVIKKNGATRTLHFNQYPTSTVLVQVVYIPTRTIFTVQALTENYCVEDRHKEYILDALLSWYGVFDRDPTMESLSSTRFRSILADFRDKLPVTTEGLNEPDQAEFF